MYRLKWDVFRALQLFVEHVVLNHPAMPFPYFRRLQLVNKLIFWGFAIYNFFLSQHLHSEKDFLEADTLRIIRKHLNLTVKEAKKKK